MAKGPRARTSARFGRIVDLLAESMPGARIELDFGSELELLVSVILSAQSTDKGVNLATPALFARYRTARDFADAEPEDLWPYVKRLGLYRAKSKAIVEAMRRIASEHGGSLPRNRRDLEGLPGVGQKTAGVILVQLGIEPAFPVDTHVGRLARRMGLTGETDPSKVEEALRQLLPPERWGAGHQLLVWHGRRVCMARSPGCDRCVVAALCEKRGVD